MFFSNAARGRISYILIGIALLLLLSGTTLLILSTQVGLSDVSPASPSEGEEVIEEDVPLSPPGSNTVWPAVFSAASIFVGVCAAVVIQLRFSQRHESGRQIVSDNKDILSLLDGETGEKYD